MSIKNNLIKRINVGDIVRRNANKFPNKIAVIEENKRYTYREFNQIVNQGARALLSLNLKKGDRISILLSNSITFLQLYFGCAKTGIVFVPININLLKHEIKYIVENSNSKAIIVESDFLDKVTTLSVETVEHIIEVKTNNDIHKNSVSIIDWENIYTNELNTEVYCEVDDRDIMQCIYTSGTTDKPKGVLSSHLAVYLNTLGTAFDLKLSHNDISIAMLPLYHVAQLNAITTPIFISAGTTVIMKNFEPVELFQLIEQEKATQIFGLPTMYRTMLDHSENSKYDLSSLRLAIYAMASFSEFDLRRAINLFNCDFALLFGQTEMGPVTAVFYPDQQLLKPGAVGIASVNVDIKIVDKYGNFLPPYEIGEIVYRSPQIMEGYINNDNDNDEVFTNGWFHSGDYGYFDQDMMLWFVDRKKDIVKTKGLNISTLEVEKTILGDPRVKSVAVIGLPHPELEEAITAFIIPKNGENINEDEIINICKARLSEFKVPKKVIFVDALPMTSTGKIKKHIIRKEYKQLYLELSY